MLYKKTVTKEMWELLQRLMKDEKLKDFNLVGGTSLSLQIGHRLSIDIDLFTTQDFDPQMMLKYLQNVYGAKEEESRLHKNTVLTYIANIKVDIVTHKYPLLNPVQETEGIRLISNEDIGAMKLHAIFQNGQRLKDFVDMYFLLDNKPLKYYLQAYEKKYEGSAFWASRALCYFGNINKEYNVTLMKGKEKSWLRMSERLKKAVANPEQNFAMLANEENINAPRKGRGFRR